MTVEKRVLKVWTYDIREKELYLDRNIRVRMVRSVAVCWEKAFIVVVSKPGKTIIYNVGGEKIQKLKDKSFSAVASCGENVIFGTD